jgi:hypothetical protein
LWGVSARLIARHPHVFLTFAEAVRSRRAEVQSPREREGVRQ